MAERCSYEINNVCPKLDPSLSEDQKFRLNKINEIKDYLVAEIKERESMSKRLSKYVVFFYCFDKSLIVLSITTGSVSIASFATVIGAPVGIISASFSLAFSISTGIVKKILEKQEIRRKNTIKLLC